AALLARLGAGHDIPIGTVIAGRNERGIEDLVGFFVNTLVLRTDVSGDPTFTALVERVRSFDLEAYRHQDVPFDQVVEALQPVRSLAGHPLFQVMLTLQNAPMAALALPGIAARLEPVPIATAKFDLTFDVTEKTDSGADPQGLEGTLIYRTDLFEHST